MWLLLAGLAFAADFTVAVTEFGNASTTGSYDALGKGLQSMITTDLAQSSQVTVVERARLAELRDEIARTQTADFDPATAVEVGKLTGASHVLTGTFTVVDDHMRLDARLVDVATGDVQLATDVAGERAAFFELEKALVKRLAESFQLALSPKERAAFARIHTADFDAFTEFSEGLALFDQERYDAALEELKAATSRDDDFKLARLTLTAYAQLVAELRTKAKRIDDARTEVARLELEGKAAAQAEVVKKLEAIANREGLQHQRERLAALMCLAKGMRKWKHGDKGFTHLRGAMDPFTMDRAGEVYAQRYFAEARPLFPAYPPGVGSFIDIRMPRLESFDADFALAVKFLDHGSKRRDIRNDIDALHDDMARALHLTPLEGVKLRDALYGELESAEGWEKPRPLDWRAVAQKYRQHHELERSTALFQGLAAGSSDSAWLKRMADELEKNAERQANIDAALARESAYPTFEEVFLAEMAPSLTQTRQDWLEPGLKASRWAAGSRRIFHPNALVFVDGLPIWPIYGAKKVRSGPRTNRSVASGLRFSADKASGSMVVAGGIPREHVAASFTVNTEIPPDYWPGEKHYRQHEAPETQGLGVAAADFVFGVQDVKWPKNYDPAQKRWVGRMVHGYAVRITRSAASVVRWTEVETGESYRYGAFDREVLGSVPLEPAARRRVEVTVDAKGVQVDVDGETLRVSLDAPVGFQGFGFSGPGYVGLDDLVLEGR